MKIRFMQQQTRWKKNTNDSTWKLWFLKIKTFWMETGLRCWCWLYIPMESGCMGDLWAIDLHQFFDYRYWSSNFWIESPNYLFPILAIKISSINGFWQVLPPIDTFLAPCVCNLAYFHKFIIHQNNIHIQSIDCQQPRATDPQPCMEHTFFTNRMWHRDKFTTCIIFPISPWEG